MHHTRESVVIMYWIPANNIGDKASFARFDFNHSTLVFVGVQINMLAFAHQSMEQARKILQPMNLLNPRDFARFLLGKFVPFPNCEFLVCFAQEQKLPMLLV